MAKLTATDRDRQAVVNAYRQQRENGLGTGASGNISCRIPDGMLITPTGASPASLEPGQLVAMSLTGDVAKGQYLPSSEWHMHAAIYRQRADAGAVVHCHSRFATSIACTGRGIPAIHYMIAVTGNNEVPLAPYATFGTEALASSVIDVLGDGRACLLANHGQIAVADTVESALKLAIEVEELAAIYWHSLLAGNAEILTDEQMAEVASAFATYGQQGKS